MISLQNATKRYGSEDEVQAVLKSVNLNVAAGEFVSIMGPSGSGKSTLLNVLGLLDRLDSGYLEIEGANMSNISERQAAKFRNANIGFIFQAYNLLPFKTALENVTLPLYYQKMSRRKRVRKAHRYLEMLEIEQLNKYLPTEISGGEAQRVAIARALVTEPKIILGDEPTGALDFVSSLNVMECIREINQKGVTVVLVTHDEQISTYATRTVQLIDGVICA